MSLYLENIKVLIVDEVKSTSFPLELILHEWKFDVLTARSISDALRKMKITIFDAVICSTTHFDAESIDIFAQFVKSGKYIPPIIINDDIFTESDYKNDVIKNLRLTRISFSDINDILIAVFNAVYNRGMGKESKLLIEVLSAIFADKLSGGEFMIEDQFNTNDDFDHYGLSESELENAVKGSKRTKATIH